MTRYTCFFLGCREQGFVGANHKEFGLIVACVGHDPRRHGYDRPYAAQEAEDTPQAPVRDDRERGGCKVPVPAPAPQLPPTAPQLAPDEMVF